MSDKKGEVVKDTITSHFALTLLTTERTSKRFQKLKRHVLHRLLGREVYKKWNTLQLL